MSLGYSAKSKMANTIGQCEFRSHEAAELSSIADGTSVMLHHSLMGLLVGILGENTEVGQNVLIF